MVVVTRPVASPHADHSPPTSPTARLPLHKRTIPFLTANPFGTDRLTLDEEPRAGQEGLERSGHLDRFEFATRWAVRPLDLLGELHELRPTIVHFSRYALR